MKRVKLEQKNNNSGQLQEDDFKSLMNFKKDIEKEKNEQERSIVKKRKNPKPNQPDPEEEQRKNQINEIDIMLKRINRLKGDNDEELLKAKGMFER